MFPGRPLPRRDASPCAATSRRPAAGSRSPTPSGTRCCPSSWSAKAPAARCATPASAWTPCSGSPLPAPPGAPPRFGKADTVSRHFRRLTHAGLWERLLRALARPDAPPALLALEHWIVSACRRAARLRGLGLVALARRLGFLSALRAPSLFLPEPDLSEIVDRWLRRAAGDARGRGPDAALLRFFRFCHRLGAFAAGRRRIPRRLQPA